MPKPTPSDELLFSLRAEIALLDAKIETIFQLLVVIVAKQSDLDVNQVLSEWLMIQQNLIDKKFAEMRELVESQNP